MALSSSPISSEREKVKIRRKISFVHQKSIVLNTTVFNNIAYGLRIRNFPKKKIEELVNEGETGWKFFPDDPQDVYRAIEKAMNTQLVTLNNMRGRGQAKAKSCTPDRVSERMLQAIFFVCNRC